MNQNRFSPTQLHLVLIGGGHAHVNVLKSFGMRPIDGLTITLISDVTNAPYSGMLPGYIEGVWDKDEIHIDLVRLASFAGANFIHDEVTAIDANARQIAIKNHPAMRYDIISINSGALPDLSPIKGADRYGIAVKPISHCVSKIPDHLPSTNTVNIIGAGVAGMEMAFALSVRYKSQAPDINVFSRSESILKTLPKKAAKLVRDQCQSAGITLHEGVAITEMTDRALYDATGMHYPSGVNFVVTGVKPAAFVKSLASAHNDMLDDKGFIKVGPTLQSPVHDSLFAAGDVASITHAPREKAGVFAVRAGAVLAKNIRRYVDQKPLQRWQPQKRYLALIGTGNGKAIATRGVLASYGRFWWWLKKRIDKAFMDKFSILPEMHQEAITPLPLYRRKKAALSDPIFAPMRCAGCAAKASASALDNAMQDAREFAINNGAKPDLMCADETARSAEDASLTAAINAPLRHSFDSISQMIPDPFIFAKIAVQHALSDLYVAGAIPAFAQAHVTLEEADEAHQTMMATQLLSGVLLALSDADTQLVGGHTAQGKSSAIGLAVSGPHSYDFDDASPRQDYHLVMTKKLGTGVGLAALMRNQLSSHAYDALLAGMLTSNQQAAKACFEAGAVAMTDITGFGLARHAANLLARLPEKWGIRLYLDQLPLLKDVQSALENGITSSMTFQNQQATNLIIAPSLMQDWRLPLLYDPQTSGGILAVIPTSNSADLIAKLADYDAKVIGALVKDSPAIMIELH
ncbi:MAG: selenide, water dikinase SelD [Candidatus Puniceispirillaceae bacterium]